MAAAAAAAEELPPAVVIHCARDQTQVGFAGDIAPSAHFPTAVSVPLRAPSASGDARMLVGDGALEQLRLDPRSANLQWPLAADSTIDDFDNFEAVMQHTFANELRVSPEERAVMLCEPPLNPKAKRERTTQIMFESLNVPALYLAGTANCVMYAAGRNTGLVVQSDEHHTCITATYEGYSLPYTTPPAPNGRDVTDALQAMLLARGGAHAIAAADRSLVCAIKDRVAHTALNIEQDLAWEREEPYQRSRRFELPDGKEIFVGEERFQCCERMFYPASDEPQPEDGQASAAAAASGSSGAKRKKGIHEAIHELITFCDVDIRKDLFSKIVLEGTGTFMEGFEDRLQREIQTLATNRYRVIVVAPPDRRFSVWIGASIIASLSTFQQMWCLAGEYSEYGPSIVHRKFV